MPNSNSVTVRHSVEFAVSKVLYKIFGATVCPKTESLDIPYFKTPMVKFVNILV